MHLLNVLNTNENTVKENMEHLNIEAAESKTWREIMTSRK